MRRAVLAILLLSAIVPSVPLMIQNLRLAVRLLPLSWERRHEELMPEWYANLQALRRRIPRAEPVAMVGAIGENLDHAAFMRYYLFPQPVKIYRDRWAYLTARNRPGIIVRPADARVTTYAEVRNGDVRRSRVVRDLVVPAETRSRFFIPIVTSSDGPAPVEYTVEGALAAGEAHVRLTLWPAGRVTDLTVHGTRPFYDLVYECFGVMEFAGWVEVESDRPLRAAFWFVNRTARAATPIRLIDGPLRTPAAFPVLPAPTLLWLLNPSADNVVAHAGTHPALVPPHGLIGIRATGTVTGPVYAFLSEKLPKGGTRFTWPDDVR